MSIAPKSTDQTTFAKALSRFQREDPTFRVSVDEESKETIISGMGELHLGIYVERIKREYNCECVTGKPRVAFRETITKSSKFDYLHKKQSGGAGQYGRVIGIIEPINFAETETETGETTSSDSSTGESSSTLSSATENEFVNQIIGGAIPTQYIASCEKGFADACVKGNLTGNKVIKVRVILQDGVAHSVDSSDLAFRIASAKAFRQAYEKAKPIILEPVMKVNIQVPTEFQGNVSSALAKRRGVIVDSDAGVDYSDIVAEVPLNEMFGYSSELRSATQGKGEFSMEYKEHLPVPQNVQAELVEEHKKYLENK